MRIIKTLLVLVVLTAFGILVQAGDEPTEAENLLPYTFQDEDHDGFPDGFKRNDNMTGKLSYDSEVYYGDSGPSIRIELAEEGQVYLDTLDRVRLELNKKYVLTLQVKVTNLAYSGSWYENGIQHAVIFYVYGVNKHTWQVITGNGSTVGWVTVIFPFDTSVLPELAFSHIYLRCLNVSGTVWFQNPAIVEIPDSIELGSHFILQNGTSVPGGNYQLK